jgi:hypothetical protein
MTPTDAGGGTAGDRRQIRLYAANGAGDRRSTHRQSGSAAVGRRGEMAILKVKTSRNVRIGAMRNNARIRVRFDTGAAKPYESIEFELDAILALAVAEEILNLLPSDRRPVAPSRGRLAGRR